jgi:hypothetical protein
MNSPVIGSKLNRNSYTNPIVPVVFARLPGWKGFQVDAGPHAAPLTYRVSLRGNSVGVSGWAAGASVTGAFVAGASAAGGWVAAGVPQAETRMLNTASMDKMKVKRLIFFLLLFEYGIFPSRKPVSLVMQNRLLLDGVRCPLDIGRPLHKPAIEL